MLIFVNLVQKFSSVSPLVSAHLAPESKKILRITVRLDCLAPNLFVFQNTEYLEVACSLSFLRHTFHFSTGETNVNENTTKIFTWKFKNYLRIFSGSKSRLLKNQRGSKKSYPITRNVFMPRGGGGGLEKRGGTFLSK